MSFLQQILEDEKKCLLASQVVPCSRIFYMYLVFGPPSLHIHAPPFVVRAKADDARSTLDWLVATMERLVDIGSVSIVTPGKSEQLVPVTHGTQLTPRPLLAGSSS